MCIYIQYTDTYTYKREFVNMSKFTTPERIFFYPIILIFALDIKRKYAIISLTNNKFINIYYYLMNFDTIFVVLILQTQLFSSDLHWTSSSPWLVFSFSRLVLSMKCIVNFFQFLFVNKSKMNTRENIQNESIQINEKKRKKLKKKFFKKKSHVKNNLNIKFLLCFHHFSFQFGLFPFFSFVWFFFL